MKHLRINFVSNPSASLPEYFLSLLVSFKAQHAVVQHKIVSTLLCICCILRVFVSFFLFLAVVRTCEMWRGEECGDSR